MKVDTPTIGPIFDGQTANALLACGVYAAAQVEAEGGDVAERMVRRLRNDKKLLKECLMEIARATQQELIVQAAKIASPPDVADHPTSRPVSNAA